MTFLSAFIIVTTCNQSCASTLKTKRSQTTKFGYIAKLFLEIKKHEKTLIRLFDMKVVSCYVFLRTYYSVCLKKKSRGKMLICYYL